MVLPDQAKRGASGLLRSTRATSRTAGIPAGDGPSGAANRSGVDAPSAGRAVSAGRGAATSAPVTSAVVSGWPATSQATDASSIMPAGSCRDGLVPPQLTISATANRTGRAPLWPSIDPPSLLPSYVAAGTSAVR